MKRIFFLDTNIIFAYGLFKEKVSEAINLTIDSISIPAKELIEKNKEDKEFITCFFVKNKEIPRLEKRRFIIIEEIRKKIKDPEFEIGSSREISERDKNWGLKIYSLINLLGEEKLFEEILGWEIAIQTRIDLLFKSMRFVIPEGEIDQKLFMIVKRNLDYSEDSTILTCAIQHNKDEKIIFVTSDIEHLGGNIISYLKEDYEIEKLKIEIPPVKYITLSNIML